jgi:hypothetical protein
MSGGSCQCREILNFLTNLDHTTILIPNVGLISSLLIETDGSFDYEEKVLAEFAHLVNAKYQKIRYPQSRKQLS